MLHHMSKLRLLNLKVLRKRKISNPATTWIKSQRKKYKSVRVKYGALNYSKQKVQGKQLDNVMIPHLKETKKR